VTEQALAGGRQTQGIVRVGQTVRRALHQRSDYVHALLRHLEAVGFDGAPRLLGIDARGREVLSYLPGEVIVRSRCGCRTPGWTARLGSSGASMTPGAGFDRPPGRRAGGGRCPCWSLSVPHPHHRPVPDGCAVVVQDQPILGAITGIGGGILRDILVCQIPVVPPRPAQP
jgi:Glycine transporter